MRLAGTLAILTLPFMALAACGDDYGDDDDPAPPVETPRAETPVASPTPPEQISDAPIIGDIIDAVRSGDPAQLEALFVFQELPCTTESAGAGGPPLCRGEPEGALVRVAPMGTCEGFYAREGELRLEDAVAGTATFNAAYAFTPQDFWADSIYGVVFALPEDDDGPQGFSVMASDEGAVGVLYGCGWTAADFAEIPGFGEVIVSKSDVG